MTKILIDTYYVSEPFPELHALKDQLLDLITESDSSTMEMPPQYKQHSSPQNTLSKSPINKLDWNKSTDFKNRPWVNLILELIHQKLNSMVQQQLGLNRIKFNDLWFQQYTQNNFHNWHIHDHNFTGAYYVELADDETNKTEVMSGEQILVPDVKEGDICFFPAFAIHRCPPIESTNRKTIISYNFDIMGMTEDQFQLMETYER